MTLWNGPHRECRYNNGRIVSMAYQRPAHFMRWRELEKHSTTSIHSTWSIQMYLGQLQQNVILQQCGCVEFLQFSWRKKRWTPRAFLSRLTASQYLHLGIVNCGFFNLESSFAANLIWGRFRLCCSHGRWDDAWNLSWSFGCSDFLPWKNCWKLSEANGLWAASSCSIFCSGAGDRYLLLWWPGSRFFQTEKTRRLCFIKHLDLWGPPADIFALGGWGVPETIRNLCFLRQSGNQLLAVFMLRCNISPAFSQVACTLLSVTCSPSKGNAETRSRLVLPSWISYSSLWQNGVLHRVSCYRFNRLLHFRKCFAPLCLRCFRAVFFTQEKILLWALCTDLQQLVLDFSALSAQCSPFENMLLDIRKVAAPAKDLGRPEFKYISVPAWATNAWNFDTIGIGPHGQCLRPKQETSCECWRPKLG